MTETRNPFRRDDPRRRDVWDDGYVAGMMDAAAEVEAESHRPGALGYAGDARYRDFHGLAVRLRGRLAAGPQP